MNCPKCYGNPVMGSTGLGLPACDRCGYIHLPGIGEWVKTERIPEKQRPKPDGPCDCDYCNPAQKQMELF